MGVADYVLSILLSIILVPCFFISILLIQVTIRLARYLWRPGSPLLARHRGMLFPRSTSSKDQAMLPCDADRAIARCERGPESSGELVVCVFCLCDIEEGEESREVRCGHLFHGACLDVWLEHHRRRARCPLCREYLVSLEESGKQADMNDDDEEADDIPLIAYVHNGWWIW